MAEISLIQDGYTVTGVIHGEEDLYPDTQITYRPVTTMERGETTSKVFSDKIKGADQEKLGAQVLADHILKWDLTHQGQPLPISTEVMLQLPPKLFDRYYTVVMGREAPDKVLDGQPLPGDAAAKN